MKILISEAQYQLIKNKIQQLNEQINSVYSFDENKLEKMYAGTYRYNGIIDTYHLSTNPQLKLDGNFTSERGGGGDYIYSSLEYKQWLDVFNDEKLGDIPTHLYITRLTNPKYKKGFTLFGKYTPSEFMSSEGNTEVVKYVGEV